MSSSCMVRTSFPSYTVLYNLYYLEICTLQCLLENDLDMVHWETFFLSNPTCWLQKVEAACWPSWASPTWVLLLLLQRTVMKLSTSNFHERNIKLQGLTNTPHQHIPLPGLNIQNIRLQTWRKNLTCCKCSQPGCRWATTSRNWS